MKNVTLFLLCCLAVGCGSSIEVVSDGDENPRIAVPQPRTPRTPEASPTPSSTPEPSPTPTPTVPACTEEDFKMADSVNSHHKDCSVDKSKNWLCHVSEEDSNSKWICLKDKPTCVHLANHSWDYLFDNNADLDCD